ncbi:MAG: Na/Pi cotransporter family protein [Magnetococcales bacterium]|nr:Na/Pi cotransporter family protein [Magnetococcales bacterium]
MENLMKLIRRNPAAWAMFGVSMFFLLTSDAAFAASVKGDVNWGKLIQMLLGGLALFLFGLDMMTDSMKRVAGDKMKDVLAKMTTNRFAGVFTGALVTSVVQSSSVTTVLVVGFVTAGLMNLSQSIGVIFGANIGTTITAQIVAFKVTKYALWMVFGGFMISIMAKDDKLKNWGLTLLGLGLVFYGMSVMSSAMKPLRSYEPFLDLMKSMENPVMGILVAAAFTGLVQSSSATTSLVIVMAGQGFVTLPAGIALAFGANIGTCVTALLACIGKSREAIQAAVVHLLFNVFGVVLWIAFIDQLGDAVIALSPDTALTGAAKLSAEVPRQIANAHTIFNVVNTIVAIPFVNQFAAIVTKLVPNKTADEAAADVQAAFKHKYLDEGMLSTAPLALSMVRREASRMGEVVENMLKEIPAGVYTGNVDHMVGVRDKDDQVDILYGEISKYLSRIGQANISEESADEAMAAMTTITELENIGDIVETHLYHLSEVCAARQVNLDKEAIATLTGFQEMIVKAFHSALVAYEHDRPDAAKMVLKLEDDIVDGMDKLVLERHQQLLSSGKVTGKEMAVFTFQSDILENYKRIYLHTKRIAKLVLHQEGSSALVAV